VLSTSYCPLVKKEGCEQREREMKEHITRAHKRKFEVIYGIKCNQLRKAEGWKEEKLRIMGEKN
jgi:hypothetical protein